MWLVEKQHGTAKTKYLIGSQGIHQQIFDSHRYQCKSEVKKKVEFEGENRKAVANEGQTMQ